MGERESLEEYWMVSEWTEAVMDSLKLHVVDPLKDREPDHDTECVDAMVSEYTVGDIETDSESVSLTLGEEDFESERDTD